MEVLRNISFYIGFIDCLPRYATFISAPHLLRSKLSTRSIKLETYNQRIDRYIDKYSSLVKYAEEMAFPSDQRGFPDEGKEWGRIRKVANRMSHPFTISGNGLQDSLGYFILVFLMQMNWAGINVSYPGYVSF